LLEIIHYISEGIYILLSTQIVSSGFVHSHSHSQCSPTGLLILSAHPQGCSSFIAHSHSRTLRASLLIESKNMSASHLLSLAGEHISHNIQHTTAAIQPHLSHIQHTTGEFFHSSVNPMVGAVGPLIGHHIQGASNTVVHGSQAVIQHLSGFCHHLPLPGMVGGGPSPQQVNWALRGFVPPKHLRMENLSYPHVSNPCESTEERLRELGLPVANLTRSPQTNNNNNQQQDEHAAAALLSSSPIQGLVPLATQAQAQAQAQAPAPSPPSLGDNNSSEFDFNNSKGQQTTLEQHLSAMSLSESGSTTVIAP